MSDAQHYAVDASIVGELAIGEVSRWKAGVCLVVAEREGEEIVGSMRGRQPDRIVVYGEGGHSVEAIDLPEDGYTAAQRINDAIRVEMEAL